MSAKMKKQIKSYQDAKQYLGSKKSRPYANNTRIEIDTLNLGHEVITVLYHGNGVVNFFPDGTTTFNSCGWKTPTTKERINWFLPDGFSLYQEKSVWYIEDYLWSNTQGRVVNGKWIFADGIAIKNGTVYNAGAEDTTKDTIKFIKKYVDGYIKALLAMEVESPSAGDCFYCVMKNDDGKNLGESLNDNSHILSHMEESYYVPSLLVNAFKFNNRLSMMAQDGIARLTSGESVSTWQAEIVSRDVKACLTAYLKHLLGIAQ
jgi:hypothetical protein